MCESSYSCGQRERAAEMPADTRSSTLILWTHTHWQAPQYGVFGLWMPRLYSTWKLLSCRSGPSAAWLNQKFVQKACSWPRESAFPTTLGEQRRTWLWNGEKTPSPHSFSDSACGADRGEQESSLDLRNTEVFLRFTANQLLLRLDSGDIPPEIFLIRGSRLSPQRQLWIEVVPPWGRLHASKKSLCLDFSMAVMVRPHEP